MKSQLRRIANLDTVEVAGSPKSPAIVMFHGYGADCYDLSPLSSEVMSPKGASWYFPNGPLQVPVGPGYTGRAWFNIDVQALEQAMRLGRHRDMSKSTPPGLEKAKILAYEFINSLGKSTEDIIIGGFSQGAMLATDIALSSTSNFRGLVILSGALIKEDEWKKLAPLHKGLRFFQSHGENDALLDPSGAERLGEILRDSGLEGDTELFRGGHEIPLNIMKKLGSFLMSLS